MELKPGIALKAHQSYLVFTSDEEHYVTVGFFELIEESLLNHLGVIHEADKLPLTKVNDALRHVQCHVYNSDLLVHRRRCLVGQKWVIDHPGLRYRLLGVVEKVVLSDLRRNEVHELLITTKLFIDDGAYESA